jgi:lipopolysaccharide/colanic/teichoic acid biosynthesis glycosyltransferase
MKTLIQGMLDLPKRLFDLLAAAIGLLLLSPLFLIIGWLIKRDSPGPVFYWGPRLGRGGRIFLMLKFRTMYENAESHQGARITARGDRRITRLGHRLRNTKINELPQLWNVFIGDMSLVGPRPEDPEIARAWSDEVRAEIVSVRPGITSPASILYHDEEDLLTAANVMNEYLRQISPDKLRLDRRYVRERSFIGDLVIIFKTMLVLMPRWTQPERSLPARSWRRRYRQAPVKH